MTDRAESGGEDTSKTSQSWKETAAGIGERQKSAGADQLTGIAGAVHAAADELDRQLPGAAGYVHQAASRIENAASGLRDRRLSDLIEDMRQLAHDRPLALFGGAVVAGFALSRFLKSADMRHADSNPEKGA